MNQNKENIPLVEKYRPTNFENIVLDPLNKQIFKNIYHKICKTCFITSNPIPLKMMLKKMDLIENDFVRLPLKIPTKDQKVLDEIKNILLNI